MTSARADGERASPHALVGLDLGATAVWRAAIADEDLRRVYPDDTFDDGGWETIPVPGHWRSVPAFAVTDGPLLHRTHFDTPAPFGPEIATGRPSNSSRVAR